MFGARHGFRVTASLLAQLALAGTARAADLPSTVVVSANESDARLSRALVLIRGELSALGLDVKVRSEEGGDASPTGGEISSQRLSLDVKDGVVVVRVFAAGAASPLIESVDLDGPELSAEVIAVRAVEALRAARLLPTPAQRDSTPKPPPDPAATEPKPVVAPPARTTPVATQERPTPILQLALGPAFVEQLQGLPQTSARAALLVGPRWGFVALGVEGSLAASEFEGEAGSARVSRRALFMQLGARLRLDHAWEVNARSGVSYVHYAARGLAQPGYLAQDLAHDAAAASLTVGGAYYFFRTFAAYLDLSGLVAFDAARVRVGQETVATLDRPSFALGAGALLGAF